MKRLLFDGETVVTSDEVALAVVDYAVKVIQNATSATIEVPILESNGTVSMHLFVLGPATKLSMTDVDGEPSALGPDAFPMPDFTPIGGRGAPVAADEVGALPLDGEMD